MKACLRVKIFFSFIYNVYPTVPTVLFQCLKNSWWGIRMRLLITDKAGLWS